MTSVVTLAERQQRRLQAMRVAIEALDAALSTYARVHGGCFTRYGSSATGEMRTRSDLDIIADYPDEAATHAACRIVDAACLDLGLVPDVRPLRWVSAGVGNRALREGVLLR